MFFIEKMFLTVRNKLFYHFFQIKSFSYETTWLDAVVAYENALHPMEN